MSYDTVRVGVCVVLQDEQGRVLLGLRKGTHGSGKWALPGGHLEKWERPQDAVARETFEEVDVIVEAVEEVGYTNNFHWSEDRHYITLYFLATKWAGSVVNREPHKCERWEWFDLNNLPDNMWGGCETLLTALRAGGGARLRGVLCTS